MRRAVLGSLVVLASAALATCSDPTDGDGDSDSDAGPDAGADAAADAEPDAETAPDGEAAPDTSWVPSCGPGEEVCGNCCDEDGIGGDEACLLDEIYPTPRLVAPGGSVETTACTRADPAYSCVDVRCASEGRVADGRFADATYQMGRSCWEHVVTLPAAGTWSCYFLRLRRNAAGECSDEGGVEIRACATVEVGS